MSFNGSIVISRCVIALPPSTKGIYCTGGNTVVESGGKRIHTFTGDGTLVVVDVGSVEYLLVAGGGGGGNGSVGAWEGGGGGAGGMLAGTTILTAGNKAIVVGDGGPSNTNGEDSTFNGLTAVGGGRGGGTNQDAIGGSGGGGRTVQVGSAGTSGQGSAGGDDASGSGSGGGGGKGGVGGNGSASTGGNGGAHEHSSISGSDVEYAGGGGGAGITPGTGGGGGGANGNSGVGTANRGGGGGGGRSVGSAAGGAGGSGILIVSYDYPDTTPTVTGGESVDAITLAPRPSPGMIGWRKCSASERAEGGYYRANITMTGPLDYLADFMLNGLMRDVRFKGPDGVQCWEGFVYEMTLNRKTAEIKISMDRVANNVWMRYRVTGSGTTVRSTAQTDATSQARYGVRDFVLTGGELENSVVADSKCKQYLQLNRQPKPTRSGPGRPDEEYSLEIICRGYFDTLNNQCYNATGGTSQGASAEATDIIASKGQFVASTEIRSNATPVSEVYDVDRRAGDIVQDIARLGDANPKRWLARMTNDRKFQYIPAAAASATVGSA